MIERTHKTDGVHRVATYSDDELYRYSLFIRWGAGSPTCFIGLNPSTATELQDDPTVRRCIDYARRWRSGGLLMLNACAYRATDPKVMLAFSGDRIGPGNTVADLKRHIRKAGCGIPVAAWGRTASLVRAGLSGNRGKDLRRSMGPLNCLGLNKDGTPAHPLYKKADLLPVQFL